MIRRISKHNDLVDYVRSCPSGVIDDIYKIEYYIQGYNSLIECNFTKKGNQLEVILPTSLLETLPNGILMRRAFYKVTDSSYPDGYYNLEFEDCMNIWLGENESEEPVIPEYVTEDELAETLSSYATQEYVTTALSGYATEDYVLDVNRAALSLMDVKISDVKVWVAGQRYATRSWVQEQGYITSSALSGYATEEYVTTALSGYATESWVQEQGYLTEHQDLSSYATVSWVEYYVENNDQNPCVRAESFDFFAAAYLSNNGYATQDWVSGQGYITSTALSGYATETYVDQAIEDAISGSDMPLPENVVEYDVDHPLIDEFGLNVDVLKRNEFDNGTDVITKGLVLAYEEKFENGDINRINTIEIRNGLLMSVNYSIDGSDYYEARDPYATESWVQNQGYITSVALSGYATETWVSQQGFASETDLSSLASRVSDLETNYGDAITISNSILS